MPETFTDRLKHAWNAFMNRDPPFTQQEWKDQGYVYSYRPDRMRFTRGNERTIVTSIYNRVAVDCASVSIQHVMLDENGRFVEQRDSGLNNCLTVEANVDQTGRAFIQDVVQSMFDEGVVAIVPVETSINPKKSNSFEILQLRTGKIVEWYPKSVGIYVFNEFTGQKERIIFPKDKVAIVENPLYSIMNEPNSTMQRLIHKLALLDAVDEQSSSGKLDMIIQLPYIIKTEQRKQQAEARRKEIEMQLTNSKYGIAYTDGTEKITQLGRSLENNLMGQIEYLTNMLYSQLGITKEILEGTADEQTMLNYNNRTIEPIISAIVDEMKRKFLTKTARSQGQTIMYFKDPFKLVPVSQIADIADKFTRNEIMSSNEIRQIIAMKPVDDPNADRLHNSNMPDYEAMGQGGQETPEEGTIEYAPGYEPEEETPEEGTIEYAPGYEPE